MARTGGRPYDLHYDCSMGDRMGETAPEEKHSGKRSKRHTSKPYSKQTTDPTLQSFYEGSDLRLVKTAIDCLILYLSLEQPFPKFVDNAHKAVFNGFIQEAIQRLSAENVSVTQDTLNKHLPDIGKLLYSTTSTWRGSLKKLAVPIVKARYQLPLGDHEMPQGGHNSQDVVDLGARKVEVLLKDDLYIRDGRDAEGHTNNYTHPAFREIILSFFYSDAHSPARNFNSYFNEKVPDVVLGLVITVVRNCIDEYKYGHRSNIPFSASSYARTYQAVMHGLGQLRKNALHSSKLTTALSLWAAQG
ncbi:hypothetical protein BT96DRAFT_1009818 [Gymnopus androsaceus JB14]|uniref:DUF6532 domain-containing protein n=1 Tax=Gymnopus androsaceus JB14 TaxID=1447944 RepID=A0A6A4GBV4_9AGAR|nr:hypothetical protein BT96DRAFT_1009818 [Gymnopus androsaceus JB14]